MSEDKIVGREAIAEYMGWSLSKLNSRMKELQDAGVIFHDHVGRPPHKTVCTFRSMLQRWCALKAQKGESV